MTRYILINQQKNTILGHSDDGKQQRPFVHIAEAYETLAKLAAHVGVSADKIGDEFLKWKLYEIKEVEGRD